MLCDVRLRQIGPVQHNAGQLVYSAWFSTEADFNRSLSRKLESQSARAAGTVQMRYCGSG